MPDITIPMLKRDLFTSEVRNLLRTDLAAGNAARVIGVSNDYHAETQYLDVKKMNAPAVWTDEEDGIVNRDLYGAPLGAVRQAAAAQFAAFGCDTMDRRIETQIESMIIHKEVDTTYTALCLSFGVIILDANPPISMALQAKEEGLSEINHEIVRGNISVLVDQELSNHDRIEAAPRVEAFLNRMVRQTLNARSDRHRFEKWLGDLTFTAVPT